MNVFVVDFDTLTLIEEVDEEDEFDRVSFGDMEAVDEDDRAKLVLISISF